MPEQRQAGSNRGARSSRRRLALPPEVEPKQATARDRTPKRSGSCSEVTFREYAGFRRSGFPGRDSDPAALRHRDSSPGAGAGLAPGARDNFRRSGVVGVATAAASVSVVATADPGRKSRLPQDERSASSGSVAVPDDGALAALGGLSTFVRLSAATAQKQEERHPDIRPAVVECAVDARETYSVALHRTDPNRLTAAPRARPNRGARNCGARRRPASPHAAEAAGLGLGSGARVTVKPTHVASSPEPL